jgi:hypothetical protein
MRLASLFCSLMALAGISAAQGTNFPLGPQYLITSDSPLLLRPIATPTMSLSPLTVSNSAEPASAGETPAPSAELPTQPDLGRIYWRGPEIQDKDKEQDKEQDKDDQDKSNKEKTSDIEITSRGPSRAQPPSILDVGVTGFTNAQSLRERGYGVPLGDAASFRKTHKPHGSRLYTNADVQRLHPS